MILYEMIINGTRNLIPEHSIISICQNTDNSYDIKIHACHDGVEIYTFSINNLAYVLSHPISINGLSIDKLKDLLKNKTIDDTDIFTQKENDEIEW